MVEQFKLVSKQNSKGKERNPCNYTTKKQIWEPQSFANIVSASKISALQLVYHPVTNSKKIAILGSETNYRFSPQKKNIIFNLDSISFSVTLALETKTTLN